MKLFLSSIGIPDKDIFMSLFETTDNLSVALIQNAQSEYTEFRKVIELEATKNLFNKLGFRYTLIDLNELDKEELKDSLSRHSAVWFMGGNTFVLNYCIEKSGLHLFICDLLDNGLVYGGESAGAVVAGKTLHGVEFVDDPNTASKVYWDGLGLIKYGIIPHWGMIEYYDSLKKCRDEMAKYCTVKTISNTESYIDISESNPTNNS